MVVGMQQECKLFPFHTITIPLLHTKPKEEWSEEKQCKCVSEHERGEERKAGLRFTFLSRQVSFLPFPWRRRDMVWI